MHKILAFAAFTLLLSACSTGIPLDKYAPQKQNRDDFTFCYGYSCTSKKQTEFTESEWKSVTALFKPAAKTPELERSKIAAAIAKMERIIGAKTGTSHDLPEARGRKEDAFQMDCLDETVNTSRYIGFLQSAGLLKFHEVGEPVHRGYIVDGAWPHNTAVVQETATKKQFVVDSFYKANGQEPYILPAKDWLAGWKPKGSKQ